MVATSGFTRRLFNLFLPKSLGYSKFKTLQWPNKLGPTCCVPIHVELSGIEQVGGLEEVGRWPKFLLALKLYDFSWRRLIELSCVGLLESK